MSWLKRLLGRTEGHAERLESAEAQRDEAAELLAETREAAHRVRRHLEPNHLGDRFQAAFQADDRRRRHA